jgi:hypothetical protein
MYGILFSDVNITFSMYYNMHGRHVNTLRVYLKETRTRREKEIFRESGSKGIPWRFYNTTVIVEGRTKVMYI